MRKRTVTVHEAKTNLSKLLVAVTSGQEIEIARGGVPVAKLVPILRAKPTRKAGRYSGQIKIGADFDAPLPEEILKHFK